MINSQKYIRDEYVFKELQRHKLRTIFSVTGYAVATVFILLILSVADANKNDSYGVLQSTGTHFIVYIPTDDNLCTSDIADGSVFAKGGYHQDAYTAAVSNSG